MLKNNITYKKRGVFMKYWKISIEELNELNKIDKRTKLYKNVRHDFKMKFDRANRAILIVEILSSLNPKEKEAIINWQTFTAMGSRYEKYNKEYKSIKEKFNLSWSGLKDIIPELKDCLN